VKGLIWRKSLFANIYDYTFGKLCFSGADQIVAISQGNIPFIKKFSKTPIEVIYRGLDFPEIKRKKQNSDSISLGFIGRLVNLKGVDVLISAFADLIDDYPDIHLQIIGDGVERQNLEKQVQSLNIQDKVSFLGYQDKNTLQNQILPSLDIFVNPSLQEGLPTTVIEALLAKCIVVATDV
jgi:glycosyltransferase, family 1